MALCGSLPMAGGTNLLSLATRLPVENLSPGKPDNAAMALLAVSVCCSASTLSSVPPTLLISAELFGALFMALGRGTHFAFPPPEFCSLDCVC